MYYNNQGQFEEALKQYQAATEIAPDEPGPISNSAYVLFALGRLDEASAAVDRALALRPDGNLAIARWVGARLLRSPRAAEFETAARKFASPDQQAIADAMIAAWEGRIRISAASSVILRRRRRAAGNASMLDSIAIGERITRAAFLRGADLAALKAAAAKETEPAVLAQYVSALAVLGDAGPAKAAMPRLLKDPATASSATGDRRARLCPGGRRQAPGRHRRAPEDSRAIPRARTCTS